MINVLMVAVEERNEHVLMEGLKQVPLGI